MRKRVESFQLAQKSKLDNLIKTRQHFRCCFRLQWANAVSVVIFCVNSFGHKRTFSLIIINYCRRRVTVWFLHLSTSYIPSRPPSSKPMQWWCIMRGAPDQQNICQGNNQQFIAPSVCLVLRKGCTEFSNWLYCFVSVFRHNPVGADKKR